VDRGPSTVGTLDIGLQHQAADELVSVARVAGATSRTHLWEVAAELLELAARVADVANRIEPIEHLGRSR
jgi:hypothetical protein